MLVYKVSAFYMHNISKRERKTKKNREYHREIENDKDIDRHRAREIERDRYIYRETGRERKREKVSRFKSLNPEAKIVPLFSLCVL